MYMIIIIIGMNVVDVLNKPCMSSRNMRLSSWAALGRDSEQYGMVQATFHNNKAQQFDAPPATSSAVSFDNML